MQRVTTETHWKIFLLALGFGRRDDVEATEETGVVN